MKINRKTLIRKFNQGALSDKESLYLEHQIIDGKINIEELETFALFKETSENEQFNMDSIDNKFYEMLAEQEDKHEIKAKHLAWFKYVPRPIRYAFPAFILAIGIFIGKIWDTGIKEPAVDNQIDLADSRSASMNQLLYNPSVSGRLQAMNHFDGSSFENQKINVLFFSLTNDESNIVRVEAIDMILKHSDNPEIRTRLISAIKEQKSPFVIQYLSEVLQGIGEEISLEKFRSLYNEEIPIEALEKMEINLHTL